ncbi:exosome complex protein Rrp42 [Candidatus Woesearchaeota archaeon]|nr:exosome complex protein Rrp42 [Candidatus Woesearchaeota archaeon]
MDYALKDHIKEYLKNDIRYDKRKFDEFRETSIETGVVKNAEGSARVRIGETEVIVGVKFELGEPYPDLQDEGTMSVNVELLAMSSPEFEPGPPGIQAIEMARVVDRGIRESKVIDTKKLCIRKGELVWMINIDICTINDAGNLLDASGIGALAALLDAKFPVEKNGKIDYKKKTSKKLGITKQPLPITVIKINDKFIVDPIHEEELVLESRLTVTTTEDGKICALQKGGDLPLSLDDISKMIDIALAKSKEIRKLFKVIK